MTSRVRTRLPSCGAAQLRETLAQRLDPISPCRDSGTCWHLSGVVCLSWLTGNPRPCPAALDGTSENAQQRLSWLLSSWGQDPAISCVARSPHPFSITLGPSDYRLTTRIVKGQPLSCFLATAHEWGHSLYEQGLPNQTHQWFAWPLGQATSMAVHESQSLVWDNRVARSFAFAKQWWGRFSAQGAPLGGPDDFWRDLKPLSPGLNRVEADELVWLIMIRTILRSPAGGRTSG